MSPPAAASSPELVQEVEGLEIRQHLARSLKAARANRHHELEQIVDQVVRGLLERRPFTARELA